MEVMERSYRDTKKSQRDKHASIMLPTSLPSILVPLGQEALRIHESTQYSAQTQFEQAKIWRGINLWLGAPAAVLAALGGSTLLGSDSWEILGMSGSVVGGILALMSAALTAILTTVNASRRQTQSQSSGNAFLQVQTAARQFATIDISNLSYEDARESLANLTSSRDELNKTADVPGRLAYRRAQRNIHNDGGQDYSVDEGM